MTGSRLRAVLALAMVVVLCALPGFGQVGDDDRAKFGPLPRLFEALEAKPGARIADVGSGDGFYTLQLARVVTPGGRVTATDIDPEALGKLRKHIESERITNVDVVLGRTDDPLLEPDMFDAVLIRNAYHEMTEHESMLRHVREALKLGGRLVVVERIPERSRRLSRPEQVAAHEIASEVVASDLLAAGFEIRRRDESFDPLTEVVNPGGYWLIVAVKPGAIPFQGGGGQAATDAAELERLEGVWNQAHLKGDVAALQRLWADELMVAVPKMKVLTRSDALQMVQSGRIRFLRYETSDVRVRVFGDAGVVTGRLRRSRERDGKVVDDDWQFTKVYVRREGRFRVVAFHASEAPE